MQCDLVNDNDKYKSRFIPAFEPNKAFGHLLAIKSSTFVKTFLSDL